MSLFITLDDRHLVDKALRDHGYEIVETDFLKRRICQRDGIYYEILGIKSIPHAMIELEPLPVPEDPTELRQEYMADLLAKLADMIGKARTEGEQQLLSHLITELESITKREITIKEI